MQQSQLPALPTSEASVWLNPIRDLFSFTLRRVKPILSSESSHTLCVRWCHLWLQRRATSAGIPAICFGSRSRKRLESSWGRAAFVISNPFLPPFFSVLRGKEQMCFPALLATNLHDPIHPGSPATADPRRPSSFHPPCCTLRSWKLILQDHSEEINWIYLTNISFFLPSYGNLFGLPMPNKSMSLSQTLMGSKTHHHRHLTLGGGQDHLPAWDLLS